MPSDCLPYHTGVSMRWLVTHSQDSTVWEILTDGAEGLSICGTSRGAGSPNGQEAQLYKKAPGLLSGKKSALRRLQESGAVVSPCALQACLSVERKHGPLSSFTKPMLVKSLLLRFFYGFSLGQVLM